MAKRDNEAGLREYLLKAFTWKWNLLGFGALLAVSFISPAPDIAIALTLAAEMTFLGGLVYLPQFRSHVDAQHHKESKAVPDPVDKQVAETQVQERLSRTINCLTTHNRTRYCALRERCFDMQKIAAGVRGDAGNSGGSSLHTEALDRMLWVFLRLLSSQEALDLFLNVTDPSTLKTQIKNLESQMTEAKEAGNAKILGALVDSAHTANARLENLNKSTDNAQFINVELDRIEGKIQALVEMSIGQEDPDWLSGQVDSIADTVSSTEETMREMAFLPGLDSEVEEAVPSILTVVA